jgi:ABC-type nitrate/sulfonate/bicarbonate transport system substrate-binding protein
MRLLRVSLAIVALVATACSGSATTAPAPTSTPAPGATQAPAATETPAALIPVRFALGNQRSIQYHPYYVAQEAGFFEEEGLDVDLQVISGGGALVQQLIAGNLDIINVGAAVPINAVAGGQDLVDWYTYFYQNIFTIVAPTAGGATTLNDIKGGVIGISEASGGEVPFVRGAFSSVGMAEGTDYQMLAIGEGGQVTYEALRTGQAQAYSSSVFDAASITTFGMPMTVIAPDDFIFVPSIDHVSTRATFDTNKDMLIRFGRAIAKAQTFSKANPEAAKAIAKLAEPELFEDQTLADAIWDTTQRLLTPPSSGVDTSLWGAAYRDGWVNYIEYASQGTVEEGALPGPVDIDKMLDRSLLAEINNFDRAAVEAYAKSYQP